MEKFEFSEIDLSALDVELGELDVEVDVSGLSDSFEIPEFEMEEEVIPPAEGETLPSVSEGESPPTSTAPVSEPTAGDILTASWRQDNWFGSTIDALTEQYKEWSFTDMEGYDVTTELAAYKDVPSEILMGSGSPSETAYRAQSYYEEVSDKKMLSEGGIEDLPLRMAVSMLDPVYLGALGLSVFTGGTSGTGATALKLAPLLNIMRNGGFVQRLGVAGLVGGAEGLATESILYATQDTRTAEEVALNTAFSVVGGSFINELGVFWSKRTQRQAEQLLRYSLTNNPSARDSLANDFGATTGLNFRLSPAIRGARSEVPEIRDTSSRLYEDAVLREGDVLGSSPSRKSHSVESIINFRTATDNANFAKVYGQHINAFASKVVGKWVSKVPFTTRQAKETFNTAVVTSFYNRRANNAALTGDEHIDAVVTAMMDRGQKYADDLVEMFTERTLRKRQDEWNLRFKGRELGDLEQAEAAALTDEIIQLAGRNGRAYQQIKDSLGNMPPVKLNEAAVLQGRPRLIDQVRQNIGAAVIRRRLAGLGEEDVNTRAALEALLPREVDEMIQFPEGADITQEVNDLAERYVTQFTRSPMNAYMNAKGIDDLSLMGQAFSDVRFMREFLDDDPQDLLSTMGGYTISRRELARQFNGDWVGDETAKKILKEVEEQAKDMDPEAAKKLLTQAQREVEDVILPGFQRMNGEFYMNLDIKGQLRPGRRKEALRVGRTLTMGAMLSNVIAGSMTDLVMPVVRHGLMRGIGAYVEAMPKLAGQAITLGAKGRRNREMLEACGVAIERWENDTAKRILGNDGVHSGTQLGLLSKTADLIQDTFGSYTFMNLWTNVMQEVAGTATRRRMLNMMNRVEKGKAIRHGDRIWLNSLAISDSDLRTFIDQRKRFGDFSVDKYGNPSNQWASRDAQQRFAVAIRKDVDSTIVKASKGDLPAMMDTDVGRTLFQFRSWSMGASTRIGVLAAQKLRTGDGAVILNTLMGFGGLVTATMFTNYIKHASKQWGKAEWEPYDTEHHFELAIANSGYFGLLPEIAALGGVGTEYTKTMTTLFDAPVLGYSQSAVGLPVSLTKGMYNQFIEGDEDAADEDYIRSASYFRKLLPAQNHFLVNYGLNAIFEK